jgi:hypothetical protein
MATKPLFDADALMAQFESATAKQGEQLRKAVAGATLQALQARELTLKNIRQTLKAVTDAAGAGAARNSGGGVDAGALIDKAVAGMDDALLKAVDANRVALGTLVAQGADLRDTHLKKALDELEKFEDTFIATVRKAAEGAGGQLGAPWAQALEKMQAGGTVSGAQASAAAEKLMHDMQDTVRRSRAVGLRAAQALAESYTAMVSGVLIGMAEALQQGAGSEPKAAPGGTRKK